MVGCVGNSDAKVGFLLSMVGTARLSSSLSSCYSSISSLVVPLIMILGSWLLVTMAGEVSYLCTIVTCTCCFASFIFLAWYFIKLGGSVRGPLVVWLGVVSGVLGYELGDWSR